MAVLPSSPSGVSYINGQYYSGGVPSEWNMPSGPLAGLYKTTVDQTMSNPAVFNHYYHLIGDPTQQTTQQQQPVASTSNPLQNQFNRLTQQANNALYGGLLGYNHNLPMMSAGSNPQTFAAPTGNFRDAFAGMQGLLGGNR